jgi:hypothetical protein
MPAWIQHLPPNVLWGAGALVVLLILWKVIAFEVKWLIRLIILGAIALAAWNYFQR